MFSDERVQLLTRFTRDVITDDGQREGPAALRMALPILRFHYVTLAVFVVLLYDTIITFDQEITHIYLGKQSFVRILWFCNRVLVPIRVGVHFIITFYRNPSGALCNFMGEVNIWLGIICLLTIQIVLCLRTAAICGRTAWITVPIFVILMSSFTSRIAVLNVYPVEHVLRYDMTWEGEICLSLAPYQVLGAFLAPAALDALLYFLTMVCLILKCTSRDDGDFVPSRSGGRRRRRSVRLCLNSFVVNLLRDGSIYYLVVVLAMGVVIIGFIHHPLQGALSESGLYVTACSIACSRLFLSFREKHREAERERDDWDGETDMAFSLNDYSRETE